MTSKIIRQLFFDYYKSKGHILVPSAPIVIKNDPTLLFTNAGMNQFKEFFLDITVPPYKRIVDTQKCLRVSGKHNDLEEVGVDTYHHTMFEMLGNWSFNDYFKIDAIQFAWELLTEVYALPKEKLYVTVFEGNEQENIPPSTIALQEWQKYVSPDHIVYGNKKDNFWEMGDTGPCGPCSEIHIDLRSEEEIKKISGRDLVNKDHPQVIEIWNLVFIQYNRKKDGSLEQLKSFHVDTGMGLERLVRAIQKKSSNYDTDIFLPTIEWIENKTGLKYDFSDSKQAIAFRVIADHIRAIVFTIGDGQIPSNTGAGYVIRRILRRAVRYYFQFLQYKQPLLYQLVSLIAIQYEDVFPEIKAQELFIQQVIEEEENSFLKTLAKGLKRIDEIIKQENKQHCIEGQQLFELYDRYGFPVDLTRLIAQENKLTINEAAFTIAMNEQKNRSKAAAEQDVSDWVILKEESQVYNPYTNFSEIKMVDILRYRTIEKNNNQFTQIVCGSVSLYAESGGQVGDSGFLQINDKSIKIIDTKKENNLIYFTIEGIHTDFDKPVSIQLDVEKRAITSAHHTATHLLHAALRNVLGTHVTQKGSLVNEHILRFDFTHFAKLTDIEIKKVEDLVNQKIKENIEVFIQEIPKDKALQMGAMALFGEKYGDVVRVVTIDKPFSVEFCGGTHTAKTGELIAFKILHESATAAGIRRIEAITSTPLLQYYQQNLMVLEHIKSILKINQDPVKSIENLKNENTETKKEIQSLQQFQINQLSSVLQHKFEVKNKVLFLVEQVEVKQLDAIKKIVLQLSAQKNNYIICLFNVVDKKIQLILATDSTQEKLIAKNILKESICPIIQGNGGGQNHFVTAVGNNIVTMHELKKVIENIVL